MLLDWISKLSNKVSTIILYIHMPSQKKFGRKKKLYELKNLNWEFPSLNLKKSFYATRLNIKTFKYCTENCLADIFVGLIHMHELKFSQEKTCRSMRSHYHRKYSTL